MGGWFDTFAPDNLAVNEHTRPCGIIDARVLVLSSTDAYYSFYLPNWMDTLPTHCSPSKKTPPIESKPSAARGFQPAYLLPETMVLIPLLLNNKKEKKHEKGKARRQNFDE